MFSFANVACGQDELPLAMNACHTADKQLVPIVERSWLHVVLIDLIMFLELKHTNLSFDHLRHHFFAPSFPWSSHHLQCSELVLETSSNISLRTLKSDNRTVASDRTGGSSVVVAYTIFDGHLMIFHPLSSRALSSRGL